MSEVPHCPSCNADTFECDALLTCTERAAWEDKFNQVSRANDDIARLQSEQRAILSPIVAKALQTWKWELRVGYDDTSFEPVDRDLGRLLGNLLVVLPFRKWSTGGGATRLRDIVVIGKNGIAVTIEVEFAENGVLLTPRGTEPIDEIAHRLSVDFDLDAFIERQKQEKLKSIDDEIAYLQQQRAFVSAGKRSEEV